MFLLLAEGCGLQVIKFILLGHHIIPFVCQVIYILAFGPLLLFHVKSFRKDVQDAASQANLTKSVAFSLRYFRHL